MPTEAEVEQHLDAVAGRALLVQRLERLTPEQRSAFYEVIGRRFGFKGFGEAGAAHST